MSVARYFARLPNPVHVAAWVDDLHFSMRTLDHPPCAGHVGGCPVCSETYTRALEMEQLWHKKAKVLNLPLSAGKGHTVNQGGAFTGVMVDTDDTFGSRYLMLLEKLAALHDNVDGLADVSLSTPRALARTRGKALHYGCAIQHLRTICASLTQAIHRAEHNTAHPPPSLAAEKDDPDFDWDASLSISTRTRAAISCMQLTLRRAGTAVQPLWPSSPSSLYGAFRESLPPAPNSRPTVVLTVFALEEGWAFSFRHHIHSPPLIGAGPWALLAPALRAHARALATRQGHSFTLDLFATHSNTITPSFYSHWWEPCAEAQDALSQLNWSSSKCPLCAAARPEYVYLFPPYSLVPAALHKAQHDQAQGVLVVP
jgi:hypothetical protein